MKVYLMVSEDKYELPTAIADTMAALAEKAGVSPSAFSQVIRRSRKYENYSGKYVEVEIDE